MFNPGNFAPTPGAAAPTVPGMPGPNHGNGQDEMQVPGMLAAAGLPVFDETEVTLPGETGVINIDDSDDEVLSFATTEPYSDSDFEETLSLASTITLPENEQPSMDPTCVIDFHVNEAFLVSIYISENSPPDAFMQWMTGNAHPDALL